MKKILAITLAGLSVAMALTACENGSYWDPNTKQLKSDKVGRIEATGTDLRVYEFTPQTAPGKQCIFVAGERKGGLQCFDKPAGNINQK